MRHNLPGTRVMKMYISKLGFIITLGMISATCNPNYNESRKRDAQKQLRSEAEKYENTIFENAFNKLISGDTLSWFEIEDFSENIDTRASFYDLLETFKKEDLFPPKYYNFEKAAEGRMTEWLLYPTELDTVPSEIKLLKKVNYSDHDSTFIYYVLQFKTSEPHWAAKDGWMIGVVGPYFTNSKPYDWPAGTFSRLSKITEVTPEEEVEWVHKNIYMKEPE